MPIFFLKPKTKRDKLSKSKPTNQNPKPKTNAQQIKTSVTSSNAQQIKSKRVRDKLKMLNKSKANLAGR